MARVTSSVTKRRRHKKILKQAKGYFGHKHIGYKSAKEQIRKSNEYAFRDRKQVKREMRKLWIKRINAATRIYETSYSQFMNGLKKAEIEINRKMLADIAVNDLEQFGHLVNEARQALGQEAVDVKSIAAGFDAPVAAKPAKEVKSKPAPKAKPVEEVKEEAPVVEATPVVEEVKVEETPVVEEKKVEEVKTEEVETKATKVDTDDIVSNAINHGEDAAENGTSITDAVKQATEEVVSETTKAVEEENK